MFIHLISHYMLLCLYVYTESDDPTVKPVSDIRASWKEQDAKNNPKPNEEPTAYSVSSRMSAWEVMSSSNQVLHSLI